MSALAELEARALGEIRGATDLAELKRVEQAFLGKKGELTQQLKQLSSLPKEERPAFGKAVNDCKVSLTKALEARERELKAEELSARLSSEGFDPTEPGSPVPYGTLHPITQITEELVDVFQGLGFSWLDGPEVEFEYYNFDALGIPGDHPARESHDTFWLRDGNVLRTHTSPVQIRAMERFGAPLSVIVPGRCFRNETVDASHEHTFYQMEGLMVGRDISVPHLIYTMKTCLREILRRDIEVRLRPGYFPFVEPGFELDVNCPFCEGEGCKVCKQSGWIEMLPCGMVHPDVLRSGGLDPEEWTGFAFGLGLQRLVMVRYGINDIRDFTGGDLRFLKQFNRI
ncbi:MAG TPA: phenylalanine--tRNA ligase subunit alpha [Planctomycetes bacterium]|nr:phenylalanine--tRNA ligase subunit alpha [Planctomycetota bacterium]